MNTTLTTTTNTTNSTSSTSSTGTAPSSRFAQWTARITAKTGAFGVTAALGLGALAALAPQCAPPAPPTLQEQVITITNQDRAAYGLGPVSANSALTNAAQAHSNDQAWANTMSHTGTDGSNAAARISRAGYRYSAWGENVAAGYGDPAAVMTAWMNSPGHRANILNGTYTQIGIGLAYATNGTPYFTMELGRPG